MIWITSFAKRDVQINLASFKLLIFSIQAIQHGHDQIVAYLASRKLDLNRADADQETYLHYAVRIPNEDNAEKIIKGTGLEGSNPLSSPVVKDREE